MAIGLVDLQAAIGVYRFQIMIGTPSFDVTHTNLVIPYTTYGNPALVGNLTIYEYSLDGVVWTAMTAEAGTVTTNLTFSPTGEAQTFTWRLKADIGQNIYNKSIVIRLQATSGAVNTALAVYNAYFSKTVVNEELAQSTYKLPEDYSGISGSDLLEKAPKVGK